MTGIPPAIADLQAVAGLLTGSGNPAARRVGDAIVAVLAGEVDGLDAALGLKAAPGRRTWRTALALAERDRFIIEAVDRHLAGLAAAEQARRLARALHRYAASAWRHERTLPSCPARLEGRIEAMCWAILKGRDYPLSERQIRDRLAAAAKKPAAR